MNGKFPRFAQRLELIGGVWQDVLYDSSSLFFIRMIRSCQLQELRIENITLQHRAQQECLVRIIRDPRIPFVRVPPNWVEEIASVGGPTVVLEKPSISLGERIKEFVMSL